MTPAPDAPPMSITSANHSSSLPAVRQAFPSRRISSTHSPVRVAIRLFVKHRHPPIRDCKHCSGSHLGNVATPVSITHHRALRKRLGSRRRTRRCHAGLLRRFAVPIRLPSVSAFVCRLWFHPPRQRSSIPPDRLPAAGESRWASCRYSMRQVGCSVRICASPSIRTADTGRAIPTMAPAGFHLVIARGPGCRRWPGTSSPRRLGP